VKFGHVSKWLYCDRRPGLANALKLHSLFRIPMGAWHQPPTVPIVVPAVAAEKAQRQAQRQARAAGAAR